MEWVSLILGGLAAIGMALKLLNAIMIGLNKTVANADLLVVLLRRFRCFKRRKTSKKDAPHEKDRP